MGTSILHRKQKLVFTAIDVISAFGIQALSTKEIARRQGIAESTIFKYFKTKNEIILSILDFYSQFDNDIILSARKQSKSPLDAIYRFISAFAEYYANYPAITAISRSYDILLHTPEFCGKGLQTSRLFAPINL